MQPFDLDVSRQSWDWLVDLAPRLHVVIDVIDESDVPVCPVAPTADAAVIRGMLTSADPQIRAAVSSAVQSKTPAVVSLDHLQAMCFGLTPGGALVLARRPSADESIEDCRQDLEVIGTWLANAIEANLAHPNAVSVEGYRFVSFRRIVREAASRGSLRTVIGAFAEALNVWDDIRVRAYVAGAGGGFFEYASAMAARPLYSSTLLDDAVVPRNGRMVRLNRADLYRAGLVADEGDTLIARLYTGADTTWALVFSGTISDSVHVRLRVYSDILRESLNDVLTATMNRVVAESSLRDVPLSEPLSTAADAALAQLTAAVGGQESALIMTTAAGQQTLAVGHTSLVAETDRPRTNRLVVQSSGAAGIMTVILERDQTAFTAFEREIAQAGAAAMHPWIAAALPRLDEFERRSNFRPVDRVFDQLAADVIAAGQPASVIVMSVDAIMVRPGLLPALVGRIRSRLRGGDRAGMVSDREIAVLLCGASADHATMVWKRLRPLVETADETNHAVRPAIGMTTRAPDSYFDGSLVGAARASAAASR